MKNNLRSFFEFIFLFLASLLFFLFGYKHFFRAVYPIRYEMIVNNLIHVYNIEPELVYAVIRTESGFDERAKSPAGALGLMQITPATFEWLQKAEGDEIIENRRLFNPEVNIKYGVMFLSILKKKYKSEEVSLCAYNAGMNAVDRWIKDKKISVDRFNIFDVPYKETRDYVKKIKKCKEMYKLIYYS